MLTYAAIATAGEIVARELTTTPLVGHPLLDRTVGAEVLVKHEHVLPTGSFKVRGGVHLAARLTDREAERGLVTCSTGNHAQSVAYAARLAGCHATVVMPACAPQVKRDAVEALGATVVMHGANLGESAAARPRARDRRRHCLPVVRRHDGCADHPRPRDRLSRAVPAGLRARRRLRADRQRDRRRRRLPGRDALMPTCRVIGVQSAAAPAAWRSWRSGAIETAPATTRASGLATSSGYSSTLAYLREGLHDFVLVSDDDIDHAARLLASHAHTLAEGAGAAALAGLLATDVRPRRVAVMCTGGNASADEIARLAAA